ncbi:MAG TPA: hypothetical protein VII78_14915 [Myxococcota bacterium]|jgi:hypothetical protein
MTKLDTQSRAVAAAIAGILAGTLLAAGCRGSAEAGAPTAGVTEANGCNGANGCSGEAMTEPASTGAHADANGCNGANGCGAEAAAE